MVVVSDEAAEEIEVLTSIFGNDQELYFDIENGMLTCQCQVKLPSRSISVYSVIGKDLVGDDVVPLDEACGGDYSQKLTYLSPVTLICQFSHSYPVERNLDNIEIQCVWLNMKEIETVESELSTMWNDGEPVIYTLISWIQDDLLAFLEIFDEIHLSDKDHEYQLNVLTRISMLDHFNHYFFKEHFSSLSHECSTCFCEYPGSDLYLLDCMHCYCQECMCMLIKTQYDQGKFCEINCSICDMFVGRHTIELHMDKDGFKRWEEKFVEQSIEYNQLVLFCPRCKEYAVREGENFAQCLSCRFTFCEMCEETWHPGNCENFVSPKCVIKSNSAPSERDRKTEEHRKQENLTHLMKKFFFSKCPKCKSWIMRDYGCNHMHCSICKTSFCYICGLLFSQHKNGYCGDVRHSAPMDMENLDDAEQSYMNIRLAQMKLPVQNKIIVDSEEPVTACVMCRGKIQRYQKNNHATCIICKTQFCFLCKTVITGTKHFSSTGCSQHGN